MNNALLLVDRDPWRYVRLFLPRLAVKTTPLPQGLDALTTWSDDKLEPTVQLGVHLNGVERRSALAHELIHVEMGAPDGECTPQNEKLTRLLTARWLLPSLYDIHARMIGHDLHSAAAALAVTPAVLLDRLRSMNECEAEIYYNL